MAGIERVNVRLANRNALDRKRPREASGWALALHPGAYIECLLDNGEIVMTRAHGTTSGVLDKLHEHLNQAPTWEASPENLRKFRAFLAPRA